MSIQDVSLSQDAPDAVLVLCIAISDLVLCYGCWVHDSDCSFESQAGQQPQASEHQQRHSAAEDSDQRRMDGPSKAGQHEGPTAAAFPDLDKHTADQCNKMRFMLQAFGDALLPFVPRQDTCICPFL